MPFGPYLVEGELARGAVGAVFRARHRERGGEVALKVLLAGERASETQRARMLREVRALVALDHPAIVPVYDAGEIEGLPYLAMELVRGETLDAHLGDLQVRPLVETVAQLARGLEQAHARGIVHRDVKPANVLLREDDQRPVLTDFGVARDLSSDSALTRSGVAVGTPAYMAPEQLRGEVQPATDVHALCAILYEGLCGTPPFTGESVLELFQAITREQPVPLREHDPRISPALERIVLRGLAKAPDQRYADGGELALALEEWLAGAAPRAGRSARPLVLGLLLGSALAGVAVPLLVPRRHPNPPLPRPSPSAPVRAASSAPARQTLVLQPGPLLGKDTSVRCDYLYVNDNYGADPGLMVGDRPDQPGDFRAFLQLDLNALPAGARLERATLSLWLLRTEFHDAGLELVLQRVVPTRNAHGQGRAQTPWLEGTSLCDALADGMVWSGDCTTIPGMRDDPRARSHRPELTQPGVDDATDYGHGPDGWVASARVAPGAQPGWVELDVTPLVRAWLSGAAENLGLRIRHAREGPPFDQGLYTFASSDNPDPALRPRLALEYLGPPAAAPREEERYDTAQVAAERALAEAEVADPSSDTALAAATRAIALAPFYGRAFWVRAHCFEARGMTVQAFMDLERVEQVPRPWVHAAARQLHARVLLRLGRKEQALSELEGALELQPDDPALLARLAEDLLQAQRPGRALQALGALPRERLTLAGLMCGARAQLAQGAAEAALSWLEQAAALEQTQAQAGAVRSATPYRELGELLLQLGRPAPAEAALRAALEIEPGDRALAERLRALQER